MRRRRSPRCCRRPLAHALAELRRDLERVEASPDLVGRVRRAIRADRRRASPGRLVAVAVLAVISLVAGGGPLGGPRPGGAPSEAALLATPSDARDARTDARADVAPDLIARLSSRSPGERREALAASARLLPRPPAAILDAWRRLAADADPAVAALAAALLGAAAPAPEAGP